MPSQPDFVLHTDRGPAPVITWLSKIWPRVGGMTWFPPPGKICYSLSAHTIYSPLLEQKLDFLRYPSPNFYHPTDSATREFVPVNQDDHLNVRRPINHTSLSLLRPRKDSVQSVSSTIRGNGSALARDIQSAVFFVPPYWSRNPLNST